MVKRNHCRALTRPARAQMLVDEVFLFRLVVAIAALLKEDSPF